MTAMRSMFYTDGYLINVYDLYHRTSAEAAAAILRTGRFVSYCQNRHEALFTNEGDGSNSRRYGDVVSAHHEALDRRRRGREPGPLPGCLQLGNHPHLHRALNDDDAGRVLDMQSERAFGLARKWSCASHWFTLREIPAAVIGLGDRCPQGEPLAGTVQVSNRNARSGVPQDPPDEDSHRGALHGTGSLLVP